MNWPTKTGREVCNVDWAGRIASESADVMERAVYTWRRLVRTGTRWFCGELWSRRAEREMSVIFGWWVSPRIIDDKADFVGSIRQLAPTGYLRPDSTAIPTTSCVAPSLAPLSLFPRQGALCDRRRPEKCVLCLPA